MAELRVAYVAVKEEVMQAWATEAVMHTDAAKAREEARRDLEPLSARVKELEEDVSLVSR
jgi:hypothetical protein